MRVVRRLSVPVGTHPMFGGCVWWGSVCQSYGAGSKNKQCSKTEAFKVAIVAGPLFGPVELRVRVKGKRLV